MANQAMTVSNGSPKRTDRADFAKVCAYLATAVGKSMGELQAEVYYDVLGDIPYPVLCKAAQRAVIENEYHSIPTPAAVRQAAIDILKPPEMNYVDAFRLAMRVAALTGPESFRQVELLPPLLRKVFDSMLGVLRGARMGNTTTIFAQFRDAYRTVQQEDRRRATLQQLEHKSWTLPQLENKA